MNDMTVAKTEYWFTWCENPNASAIVDMNCIKSTVQARAPRAPRGLRDSRPGAGPAWDAG